MVTCTGEQEMGALSGRLSDNPGELACIIIIFWPQYMSNQYMRLRAVFEAWCENSSFSLFILFDLLLTASNFIFGLGLGVWTQVKFRRICNWSHQSITGLEYLRDN